MLYIQCWWWPLFVSVIEEQKTDAIAFSEVSTPASASEITEIKETETSDTKTNIGMWAKLCSILLVNLCSMFTPFDQKKLCFLVSAKMSGLSYIVTKKEDLIEVVNSVNVGTVIQEELKGMLYFMGFLIILCRFSVNKPKIFSTTQPTAANYARNYHDVYIVNIILVQNQPAKDLFMYKLITSFKFSFFGSQKYNIL